MTLDTLSEILLLPSEILSGWERGDRPMHDQDLLNLETIFGQTLIERPFNSLMRTVPDIIQGCNTPTNNTELSR